MMNRARSCTVPVAERWSLVVDVAFLKCKLHDRRPRLQCPGRPRSSSSWSNLCINRKSKKLRGNIECCIALFLSLASERHLVQHTMF